MSAAAGGGRCAASVREAQVQFEAQRRHAQEAQSNTKVTLPPLVQHKGDPSPISRGCAGAGKSGPACTTSALCF